jgi:hypothetical protein
VSLGPLGDPKRMRYFAAILVVLLVGCAARIPFALPCTPRDMRDDPFLKRLVRSETINEAEVRHRVNGVPFGSLAVEWKLLKDHMQPGDRLWWFERQRNVAFQGELEGYVVMRGCHIVDRLVLVAD